MKTGKIIFKGIVIFLFILFLSTIPADATPPVRIIQQDLQLHIVLDKNVYTPGEDIDVHAIFINKTHQPIKVYSPEYWGTSTIYVLTDRGEVLTPGILQVKRGAFEEFKVIPSGESVTHVYRNLTWFGDGGGAREFNGEHKLKPGVYYVYVNFINPPQGFEKDHVWEKTWAGWVESNVVRFTVKSVNDQVK